MIFTYGKIKMKVPDEYAFVYYATFIAGEYDCIKVNKNDVVLDAGAFIGDFTLKIARKVKEVVAVEPLPWAFKLLKENIELNELKNVTLVNKALWSVDGKKVKITDNSVGSKIDEKGEIEVSTVTIDSLGKFSVVKMDIEGAEGEIIKEDSDWLNYVRSIGIELHGENNVINIPKILKSKGFEIKEMTKGILIKNTLRNVFFHPFDFIKAEMKTRIALKTLKKEYNIPALESPKIKIIYGRRI